MIYVDVDFFIALAKDDDWLQEPARELLEEHEGELYTSRATLLELLVISDRFTFDRTSALAHALEIATVQEDESVLFQAADYMESYDVTAFDAYHAAYAGSDPILSSDSAYDALDVDRVALEPDDDVSS